MPSGSHSQRKLKFEWTCRMSPMAPELMISYYTKACDCGECVTKHKLSELTD